MSDFGLGKEVLQAELKHGRLAMFAAVAWPLAEAESGSVAHRCADR